MKVIPKRTNETAVRCLLDGPALNALLSEAAAKAAGLDLTAHNVKVERVEVKGVDYSQHRREPTAIVDLVVIHDPEAMADWVAEHQPVKPPPPEPPPMRCPALKKGYRPDKVFWTVAQIVIWGVLFCWCLGVFAMK
jgi:hypothetical protein